MSYKTRLDKMIHDLAAKEGIGIIRCDIGSSTNELILQSVIKAYGVKNIPKEVKQLYAEMSSCRIEWVLDLSKHPLIERYYKEDQSVNGSIHVRPIEEFLRYDSKLNSAFWTNNFEADEIVGLKNFRYLDFNDDYTRVGYIMTGEKEMKDKLYVVNQGSSGFYPANLSLSEYFEKMVYYKGFQGWQYNYFFQDSDNYKRMMFYLKQLFNQ